MFDFLSPEYVQYEVILTKRRRDPTLSVRTGCNEYFTYFQIYFITCIFMTLFVCQVDVQEKDKN